jgi:hypothetical protein
VLPAGYRFRFRARGGADTGGGAAVAERAHLELGAFEVEGIAELRARR